jgi:hypothetical protein
MWFTIAHTVLTSLISMGSALLTEGFLKHAVVIALEKVSTRTKTDVDDKLLEAAKQAWGI